MKASRKALFLGLCMAVSTVAVVASAGVVVDIDVAPPPLRIETMPPPRVGFVWAPGYWEWRGREHVWVAGRWVGERRGYRWGPDRWGRSGGRWAHWRSDWER